MLITENELRRIIRKEILKSSNNLINEIDLGLTAAAVGGVLVGGRILKRFFDKFRQSNVKKLTFDFIKNSPRLFGKKYKYSNSITLEDIENWSNQDQRLDKMGNRGLGGRYFDKNESIKLLSTTTVYLLDIFDHREASNIFIKDTSFSFDPEDINFFNRVYNIIRRPSNKFSGDEKSKLIDAMFYTMVRLYVKKYSSESLEATSEIEEKVSRIIGTPITLTGKNSWETPSEYKNSLNAPTISGPGRAIISLPTRISNSLNYDQLIQIASVQAQHGSNTTAFITLPFSARSTNGIDLISLTSKMRSLKNRWKFITNILIAIKDVTKLGTSGSLSKFLEILLEKFATDSENKEAAEFLVNAISNSNMREGNLKEAIKLVIRVSLS